MSREPTVEMLVREGLSAARQGAVLVVEAKEYHPTRVRWLGQRLAELLSGTVVHRGGDSLFLVVVPHAGPAEAWLLVDRLRRQLARTGWERVVVASASWPVQGSSPTDVVAAALAALFNERSRLAVAVGQQDFVFDFEFAAFDWRAEAELLTG